MTFKRLNSIKKKADLDRVFRQGKTRKGNFLYLKYIDRGLEYPRFSITVPSRIYSKATARNRIKRVISEMLKLKFNDIPSFDFLVVISKKTEEAEYLKELIHILNEKNRH